MKHNVSAAFQQNPPHAKNGTSDETINHMPKNGTSDETNQIDELFPMDFETEMKEIDQVLAQKMLFNVLPILHGNC